MIVSYANAERDGLASLVGRLIEQNLDRDPGRCRLLRPAVVALTAPDAGVSATLRIDPGRVEVSGGAADRCHLHVTTDAVLLLELAAVPLRFGLPDLLTRRGRGVLGSLLRGEVRVRGMLRHPVRLARLNLLLSAR